MLQIDSHRMVSYDFTSKTSTVEIQVLTAVENVPQDIPAALLEQINKALKRKPTKYLPNMARILRYGRFLQ